MKFLVIEDDAIQQKSMSIVLKKNYGGGTEVSIAGSVEEAIDKVWEEKYNYMFFDLNLNRRSSIEIVPFLNGSKNENTPKVIVSGYIDMLSNTFDDDKRHLEDIVIEKGFTGFLEKPVNPDILCSLVDEKFKGEENEN